MMMLKSILDRQLQICPATRELHSCGLPTFELDLPFLADSRRAALLPNCFKGCIGSPSGT
jgi:hypothetical protein